MPHIDKNLRARLLITRRNEVLAKEKIAEVLKTTPEPGESAEQFKEKVDGKINNNSRPPEE